MANTFPSHNTGLFHWTLEEKKSLIPEEAIQKLKETEEILIKKLELIGGCEFSDVGVGNHWSSVRLFSFLLVLFCMCSFVFDTETW